MKKKINPRETAVKVLMQVVEENAYSNRALAKALELSSDPRDSSLCTNLTMVTLRNLILIDHIIDSFSKLPVTKMKPFIRNLLRITLCELRFMGGSADYAAVNEAVNLTKFFGYGSLSGFVNGVLRNIVRNPNKPLLPKQNQPALLYSFPQALAKDLSKWLGEADTKVYMENSLTPPGVTIYANTTKISKFELMEKLVNLEPVLLDESDSFFALKSPKNITEIPEFKNGEFFVMDYGTSLSLSYMNPQPGETLIDLTAAPGGKAFAMACMMKNQGLISAYDIHPHKLRLLESTSRKLGLSIIKSGINDASEFNPQIKKADAVLLDVPCSGLGTIRKHPEIKYKRTRDEIKKLSSQSKKMLETASKYVKPGGRLVYSTCTITPHENENVCETFAAKAGIKIVKSKTWLPGEYNDGFYAAEFKM